MPVWFLQAVQKLLISMPFLTSLKKGIFVPLSMSFPKNLFRLMIR